MTRLALGALVFFVVAAGAIGASMALDHSAALASASSNAFVTSAARSDAVSEVPSTTPVDEVAAVTPALVEASVEADGAAGEAAGEGAGDAAMVSGLVAPVISDWLPDAPRCHRRGRRFCDGPRLVPVPHGPDAERAERLALGSRRSYDRVLSGPADPELLAEAGTPEEDLLWPVPEGVRGRGFGYVRRRRLRQRLHRGVDIPAAVGALVRSTNEGLVIYADNEVRGYGNLVVILHGDDTRTLYAHLERAYVFAGQNVTRGEVIGAVGRTGLTRAPHLHFEWRRRAVPRNPSRRFVDRPDEETERRLYHEQLVRRREGRARLAVQREARERRQARRAEQQAQENLRAERALVLDAQQNGPSDALELEPETDAIP